MLFQFIVVLTTRQSKASWMVPRPTSIHTTLLCAAPFSRCRARTIALRHITTQTIRSRLSKTMKKMGACDVKYLLFYTVDSSFPYSVLLCRGVHNHPLPPPSSKTDPLTPRFSNCLVARPSLRTRYQPSNALRHWPSCAHATIALHPSLVFEGTIRNNFGPKSNNVIDDQLALMQMLVSSGKSNYLQEVTLTDKHFFAFAMHRQGAVVLSRAKVFDVDMTFACTRGEINMVKATLFDEVYRL
ncbi:hypothetical protein BCR44DRAFT_80031 [Catenaria anguillulae PL171]|uniref:Uncharacterized protein n=1 Tax=Catenaria anguillulae PL171 TaxID=765915 RepID=A0A1Y2H6D9_9FUNG|nr:hypothetical protein BCR44DRAFT_80031 [Catenaria anguillulae PL171]